MNRHARAGHHQSRRKLLKRDREIWTPDDFRVRKRQILRFRHQLAVENKVEIDGPGRIPVPRPHAPQLSLNAPQDALLHFAGRLLRFDFDDAVIIGRLLGPFFRRREVDRGDRADRGPAGQQEDGLFYILFGINVRSDADKGTCHDRSGCRLVISTPTLRAYRRAVGFSTFTRTSETAGCSRQIAATASASASTRKNREFSAMAATFFLMAR